MKKLSKDFLNLFIIFIISFILVSDLLINTGRSATFDGPTHLANIALFFKSLTQGEWHVTWTDGFANYGMPLGLIAQQLTSYLGAIINLVVTNVVLSYDLTFFIGAFLSTVSFYYFLRLYFKENSSLLGAILFCFAPYRIINIYIRGALPEFFSSVSLPLILIGLFYLFNNKQVKGFLILTASVSLLILTHPMMFVVNAFIYIPYFIYLFIRKRNFVSMILCLLSFALGMGLTGYYFIPLLIEIKYFYYGLSKNHFAPNQYMTLSNFFNPKWFYYYKGDIFTRGHFIKSGLIETIILITGALVVSFELLKKRIKEIDRYIIFIILITIIIVFFMTRWAIPFYKLNILGSYQHQWRLFSSLIFLPPIVLAYLSEKINKKLFIILMIFIICLARFPQIYGKNYVVYPEKEYFFYRENLHANVMNTVWSGEARDYPIEPIKPAIVEGKGRLNIIQIKPSMRQYKIEARTDIRMADYTFYFPGWKVFVDGKETEIQFQDPNFRGVITYNVPKGNHEVLIVFKDTKVRMAGIVVTIFSAILFFIIIVKYVFIKKTK